jgi:peptidyl-prolyl cis-trans isomerase D
MLKAMRESFQHMKWILLLIVAAFILLVFVDWGGAGRAGDVTGVAYAAKVNGETITVGEFQRALYMLDRQYEEVYGQRLTDEDREAMGLHRQVLQNLVNQKLLLQAARRMSLSAAPDEIRNQIRQIPVLNPDGEFVGTELYERYVRTALNYNSAAAFEAELAEDLVLMKIESALRNSVVIPDRMVEEEFRRRNESASIRYVLLPAQDQMADVRVSPEEVSDHYRQNASRYTHPAQRRVQYLQVNTDALRSSISITDQEVRQEYQANAAAEERVRAQHVLISIPPGSGPEQEDEALRTAEQVVQRARAGEDFGDLAREFSDDPGSAGEGGDLGEFGRGRMVPEFEEASFSQPIGQVGDPVRTSYGYHVILVNERKTRTPAEAEREIRERLLDRKLSQESTERLRAAQARLPQTGVTPEQMQQLQSDVLQYNDTGWFGQNDPVPGLGRVPELNAWAFSADIRSVGNVIDNRFLDGPILPYVVGSRDAGITPLAEIRNRVEEDLRRQRGREAAAESLRQLQTGSLESVAGEKGLAVNSVTVRPGTPVEGITGNTAALAQAVFDQREGQLGGPVIVDAGAVMFEITEVTRFDQGQFDAEKHGLREDLRQQEVRKLRAALLDKLRQEAKIQINQDMLPGPQRSL